MQDGIHSLKTMVSLKTQTRSPPQVCVIHSLPYSGNYNQPHSWAPSFNLPWSEALLGLSKKTSWFILACYFSAIPRNCTSKASLDTPSELKSSVGTESTQVHICHCLSSQHPETQYVSKVQAETENHGVPILLCVKETCL